MLKERWLYVEAEEALRQALAITEAKLGKNNVLAATTLHELGVCLRKDGWHDEAEILWRALVIRRAKLGEHDIQVAYTLHEVGVCLRDSRRNGEAEQVLRQTLAIENT